jgi:hypothetical protein
LPRIERSVSTLLTVGAVALVLVGCSSGAAREAARDQARDAGLEQRLAEEQATRTAERYFPPTGTPAPTEPPRPSLRTLVITFGFRADGTPDGSYASIPAGSGTAYAGAQLAGVSLGQTIRAIVTDAWGNEIATPELAIEPGAADRWVALPIGLPAELAPGQYGVFVFEGDRPLGSLAFGVTGAGSSAQLLPELPANPQVRSTLPPPGVAPAQETPTIAPGA